MVKKIFISVIIVQLLFVIVLQGQSQLYKLLNDGAIIYPDKNFSGNAEAVQIQFVSNNIVHIIASPSKNISPRESLIAAYKPVKVDFKTKEETGRLELATSSLKVVVNTITATISFADKAGKPIVAESVNGKKIQPAVFEGTPLYRLKQTFETSTDDAYYGLGQHQEDVWNYKGKQVIFFQNNTQVAVPFLVSVKNYGILWDNYSYSKVGDTRDYQPLSTLKLFDQNNNEGWLTASYANDRNKPDSIALEKAESEIAYPYVNDIKLKLPKDFDIGKGMVTWTGSIASETEGVHKLKIDYAGYIKIWLEGKLLFDRWRQAWNPGTGTLEIPLQKAKKYAIKIEWIPDGAESYLNFGYLPPVTEENTFTFDSEAGRQIDYYFVYGKNIDQVISGYRTLTGKAPIVPKWAMGFWQSRERYKTQEEILNTVSEFRKCNIPLDNIVLDWFYWKENQWGSQQFDATRFPSPEKMIETLHKKYNAQLMISVWPKFYEGVDNYKAFDAKGWLYKRNIADRQIDWVGKGYVSTFYDAFNKEARESFWELIRKNLYTKGIDAWWMDASEPDILSNVSPEKRKLQMTPTALGTAAEFLNAYPLQNAKGIYEGQRSTEPNKRVFLLTRSGFAGSQRYAAVIWSGDIASRWEDMKAQISAGLNFSISGLPYWTMDIGGFSTEARYNKVPMLQADEEEWRELQTRWYQWGSFIPLFRAHGQFPVREIYNIAPQTHLAYQSILYYNKLRYRLMPYIYSLAGSAYHQDYTIMRGLVMDFEKDRNAWNIGDQFMFGPSLLINPVYNYKARSRKVYLPEAQGWYDWYSGKYIGGGQNINADAPYDRVPIFVKEGSIIPVGPELQYAAEKPADPITLFIYTGKDASFTLYEDENVNYNYEKGNYTEIPFYWNESVKRLIIGDRKGNFAGMLKNRIFKIILISKEKPIEMNFEASPFRTLKYYGKKQVIQL